MEAICNETTRTALQSFKGTAKEFEAKGVKLNGQPLDQITVNALARHGLIQVVGEGEKPARGRTPKLYEAVAHEGFVLEL